MGFLYNPTDEKVVVKALGNFFTFAPKKLKQLEDSVSKFISEEKKYEGIVAMSDHFNRQMQEDYGYQNTAEGKAEIEQKAKEGLQAYIQYHQSKVENALYSLRKDFEQKNIKIDPLLRLTPGDMDSMRIIEKYKSDTNHEAERRADEARKIAEKLGLDVARSATTEPAPKQVRK